MPQNDRLTPKQRKLLKELDQIAGLLRLDYNEIRKYRKKWRSFQLEYIKRHLVRGEVVFRYTFIDEYLNNVLCRYFFGRKTSFIRLWKTKKFKNFNYYFLEKLSLMEKLAY